MSKKRHYISFSNIEVLVGFVLLCVIATIIGGSRLSRLNNSEAISPSVAGKPVDIYLKKSIGLNSLGDILVDSGAVNNKTEFIWAAKLLGWRTFRRGHYQIEGEYSYNTFLSKLARGIQDPIHLTLLPGITKRHLINSFSEKMEFDSLSFEKTINDSSFLAGIGLTPINFMGHMLPSTYSIYWTSSPEAVIKRINREFDNKVYKSNPNRFEELNKSVDEVLTLASIIEWEAKSKDEKRTISGLYWNRLNRDMPLQADPTINFAIKERRRLLYKDYQIDNPYNTYIHRGLPPGPITNPALSSIEAALYPEANDYLYMVASPDGTHAFSETFKEHKKKSEQWRKWLQKQYRIKRKHEREEQQKEVNS